MPPIISVENLGKRYLLRHQARQESAYQYLTLREEAGRWARGLFRRSPGAPRASREEFWALKDVSFEIEEGKAVGIIGRNGAGKSTLLKILSRITEPTEGRATLRGRVASLLEVGTGFHPELTGRENIFLNGAILGMTRAEIRGKFDEIVDFAEVERFLDTPVKRYSSGMYVRLAFSVAAHLEPEILIVDEVLAVGDATFQRKCLGRMEQVTGEGRTVIFVSHNMGAVSSFCHRALLLEGGSVVKSGPTTEVVPAYYRRGGSSPSEVDYEKAGIRVEGSGAQLLSACITDLAGETRSSVAIDEPCQVRMRYRLKPGSEGSPYPNFHFFDSAGNYAFAVLPNNVSLPSSAGDYEAICEVPEGFLNDGTFFIGLALTYIRKGADVAFFERDALTLQVFDPIERTLHTSRNGYAGTISGVVRPKLNWHIIDLA
jgi:lipopolysaccharide transport system ATP-binding protein